MLQAKDVRGWLHIYDAELLRDLTRAASPPPHLLEQRPVLELATKDDPRLRAALHGEIQFWHELDRVRLRIYQRAVRPYWQTLKRSRLSRSAGLAVQHEMRIRCAEKRLPMDPLAEYGVGRMITEARDAVAQLVNPSALKWLPDVSGHFRLTEA